MPYYEHDTPEESEDCDCPIHLIHEKLPREKKLEILANAMVAASLLQGAALFIAAPLMSVSLAQMADIWEIPKSKILERTVEILEEGVGSSSQEAANLIEGVKFHESYHPTFSELPAHKKEQG